MTRAISEALKEHLASGSTTVTTCCKATLTNGTVVTVTELDQSFTFDGLTYLATGAFNHSEITISSDLSVDNLEIEGFLTGPLITETDIVVGRWDYAEFEFFLVNHNDLSMGRLVSLKGTLGEIRAGRARFTAELRGQLQKLSKHIVKVTTKDCTHDLGDARCGVNLAAITVTGSVTTATSQREFTDTTRTEANDHFTGALLTWTGGLNDGLQMEVRRSTSAGVIELHQSMPYEIQVGDTYSVYAGCLKRFTEDCVGKHNNGPRFGGFPHLPLTNVYKRPTK